MKNLTGLCTLLFFFVYNLSFSQEENLIKRKSFEFGIGIQYNSDDIVLDNIQSDIVLATNRGIGTSILTKYNASEKLSVLLESIIVFRDQNLLLTDINGNALEDGAFNQVTIDVPLHISYQIFNKSHFPFLHVGPRYRFNLVGNDGNLISLKRHQFSYDIGISFDFKTKNFTLRPVLNYTRGLTDLIDTNLSTVNGSSLRMHGYSIKFLFFG